MSEENGQATEPTEEPAPETPRVEAPAEDSRDTTRLLPRSNEEYDKVAGRIWTAAAEEAGNWGLGVMIITWNPSGGWRSRWPTGVNQNALIGMLAVLARGNSMIQAGSYGDWSLCVLQWVTLAVAISAIQPPRPPRRCGCLWI